MFLKVLEIELVDLLKILPPGCRSKLPWSCSSGPHPPLNLLRLTDLVLAVWTTVKAAGMEIIREWWFSVVVDV